MSYADDAGLRNRLDTFTQLSSRKPTIESHVQTWVSDATAAHAAEPDAAKKTEIIALRDALIASLTAILTP